MQFVASIILSSLLVAQPVAASEPVEIVPYTSEAPVLFSSTTTYEQDTKFLIEKYGKEYNVSTSTMYKVVGCETGYEFDPKMQSLIISTNGVQENSWGLAQINLPAHPETTKEQAQDPDYSLDFLAKNLAEHPSMWTCWRNLKKAGII